MSHTSTWTVLGGIVSHAWSNYGEPVHICNGRFAMPYKDFNLKTTFDADYDIGAEGEWGHPNTRLEVRLHYHRAVMLPLCRDRAAHIPTLLGWSLTTRVVIVGAGFGWTAECLEVLGYTNILAVDTSLYIQSNKTVDESAEYDTEIVKVGLNPLFGDGAFLKERLIIQQGGAGARSRCSRGVLNEDGSTPQSRTRIRQALGNVAPEWVLTESVVEGLTNTEAQTLSSRAHQLATNVAHYVVTARDGQVPGEYNWQSLEAWKVLLPNDTLIEAGTYRVL